MSPPLVEFKDAVDIFLRSFEGGFEQGDFRSVFHRERTDNIASVNGGKPDSRFHHAILWMTMISLLLQSLLENVDKVVLAFVSLLQRVLHRKTLAIVCADVGPSIIHAFNTAGLHLDHEQALPRMKNGKIRFPVHHGASTDAFVPTEGMKNGILIR